MCHISPLGLGLIVILTAIYIGVTCLPLRPTSLSDAPRVEATCWISTLVSSPHDVTQYLILPAKLLDEIRIASLLQPTSYIYLGYCRYHDSVRLADATCINARYDPHQASTQFLFLFFFCQNSSVHITPNQRYERCIQLIYHCQWYWNTSHLASLLSNNYFIKLIT